MHCHKLQLIDAQKKSEYQSVLGSTISALRAKKIVTFALVATVVLLISINGRAQTNLSSITGTLTDNTGAVVANCQIAVTNLSTTAIRSAVTDGKGFYSVTALPIGSYKVVASCTGFKTSTSVVDLTLSGATTNFMLTIGSLEQNVTVNAATGSVALQTDNHVVSQSFSPEQLTTLPNTNGVSVLSIAVLGPSSQAGTDEPTPGDVAVFNQTTSSVNIAGLGIARTEFLQDGVDNINLLTQTANVVSTVEASAGVTTMLNGSPARFTEPAVVDVITRGGTNQFHGLLYDFLQNNDLNATNYFAVTKPPLRYNLFGGDLGGPIIRNKVFGFFDYSGLRSHTDAVSQNRVPTLAERSGDFSNDNISQTIYDPATYNAATGSISPFPGNIVPAARIDSFAKLWLPLYPLPNFPLGATNINYVANVPTISNSDEEISRVDWNASTKDQVAATFFHYTRTQATASIVPDLFGSIFDSSGTNAMLQLTHVFNANIVNIAKAAYNRSDVVESEYGAGAKNYATEYGLNNVNSLPQQWAPPTVSVSNYTSFGNPYTPDGALQNRFQYADEVDWKLGNHTVAFGGEFVRTQFNGFWVIANNGIYNFDGSATSQYVNGQRSSTSTGNAFADFLLGFPQSSSTANGTTVGAFRESQVEGYIQDDWKLSQRLTLNLGMRYSFDNPPIDKNGLSALYVVPTNRLIRGNWNTNYNDWGPRFGFAWNADSKMVIRGGYGIYYAPILYNSLQFQLMYSPNFTTQNKLIDIADPVSTQDQFGLPSSGVTTWGITKVLKDQSAQEWNLSLEQSLNENTLLTIAYIGDVLRHEATFADVNQPDALSPGNTSGILDVSPQPLASSTLTYQVNLYNAGYNALAASLNRRYANGLQFLASYTWSKAMDIVDGDNETVQNFYHPGLQRSPAAFDRTNNFLLSGTYDIPVGQGRRFANNSGWLSREVIGGWRLSIIQQLATGQPITIGANNTADTSTNHAMYAREVCNPNDGFTKTRFTFFNSACFVQPPPGTYGTSRDAVRVPGVNPTNLSLFKSFDIYKEHQLQFRVDAFSALNHPMFGQGTQSVTAPNLGQLTYEASGQRTLQVSLKYQF
jgi:hypothetical protein